MKKFLAVLLVLALSASLFACGKKEEEKPEDTSAEQTEDTSAEDTSSEEDTSAEEKTVMTYADYVAAELDSEVCFECYVQGNQSWWDNKITVYAADQDGAYFLYNMTCSEEDAAKLTAGTKILVTGTKIEWSGEVEVAEGATFEFVEGDTYVADAKDLTEKLGTEELIDFQNQLATFKGLTVKSVEKKDSDSDPDLYLTVTLGDAEYSFCVENYLTGPDTETYKTVEGLTEGQTVDVTGYAYWYNGINTHITEVTVVE